MAIAIDATSTVAQSTASSKTWSHTCTGSELVLVVFPTSSGNVTVTGITYNGVALTQGPNLGPTLRNGTYLVSSLWYLVAPATGANDIVVTFSGSTTGAGGCAASYTGVDQGAPINVQNTNSCDETSSPLSTSVTTTVDNCWTVLAGGSNNAALVAGTGSTARTNGGFGCYLYDSNAALTPAGSKSMETTWSGNNSVFHAMIGLAPVQPSAVKTVDGLARASVKTVNGLAIASVKTINGLA